MEIVDTDTDQILRDPCSGNCQLHCASSIAFLNKTSQYEPAGEERVCLNRQTGKDLGSCCTDEQQSSPGPGCKTAD